MAENKLEEMKSILNKLEGIKNTQESIIDKINHVITDLFDLPNKDLEKTMEKAHQKASENVETIQEAIEKYEMEVNRLDMQ